VGAWAVDEDTCLLSQLHIVAAWGRKSYFTHLSLGFFICVYLVELLWGLDEACSRKPGMWDVPKKGL